MSEDLKLDPASTALLIIDVQEKLAAAMQDAARIRCVRKIDMLLEAARLFGMPVLVSEQYPKGLGHTVADLKERLESFETPPPVVEKVAFDANGSADFANVFDDLAGESGSVRTVLVTGMEAHICVYQTVRGCVGAGYRVHVPWDATCSRDGADQQVARELWTRAGAVTTTTETVLFDLLGSAKHEHFRAISKLVR